MAKDADVSDLIGTGPDNPRARMGGKMKVAPFVNFTTICRSFRS